MNDKDEKKRQVAGEKANPARGEKLKSALRANLQRRKAKARAERPADSVNQKPHGAD